MMTAVPERYVVQGWTEIMLELPEGHELDPQASGRDGEADAPGTGAVDGLTEGAAEMHDAGRDRARILIVEDEELVREAVRELLEEEGFDVVGECSDGADAVRVAKELRPAVILMDLRMPGMDGIEATARVKEALPSTQVIMLTAYDDPALRGGAIDAGAYCFMPKGTSSQLIIQTIHDAWSLAQEMSDAE